MGQSQVVAGDVRRGCLAGLRGLRRANPYPRRSDTAPGRSDIIPGLHEVALALSGIADPLHHSARVGPVVVDLVSAIVVRQSLAVLVRSAVTSDIAIDVVV